MTAKIFRSIIEAPQEKFFFIAKRNLYSNKYFLWNFFLHAKISFVVCITQLWIHKIYIFSVSQDNFQICSKRPIIFVWHVFVWLDQCMIKYNFRFFWNQHWTFLPNFKSLIVSLYQLSKTKLRQSRPFGLIVTARLSNLWWLSSWLTKVFATYVWL